VQEQKQKEEVELEKKKDEENRKRLSEKYSVAINEHNSYEWEYVEYVQTHREKISCAVEDRGLGFSEGAGRMITYIYDQRAQDLILKSGNITRDNCEQRK
jgi:hypothetical protein